MSELQVARPDLNPRLASPVYAPGIGRLDTAEAQKGRRKRKGSKRGGRKKGSSRSTRKSY